MYLLADVRKYLRGGHAWKGMRTENVNSLALLGGPRDRAPGITQRPIFAGGAVTERLIREAALRGTQVTSTTTRGVVMKPWVDNIGEIPYPDPILREAQAMLWEEEGASLTMAAAGSTIGWLGFFDGASRGNPGPGGAGAFLRGPAGETRWWGACDLPDVTNNEAECAACELLLDFLLNVAPRSWFVGVETPPPGAPDGPEAPDDGETLLTPAEQWEAQERASTAATRRADDAMKADTRVKITIYGDSEVVIKFLRKRAVPRAPTMVARVDRMRAKIALLKHRVPPVAVGFAHVLRESNSIADAIANFGVEGGASRHAPTGGPDRRSGSPEALS